MCLSHLYIMWAESVNTRVKCPIRSDISSSVQQNTCIRQRQLVTVHYYLLCQRTPIATYNRRIPSYLFLYTYCYRHEHLPFFLHTHWVTFWRPWIFTSRYWMFYFINQVLMSSYASREAWSYPRLDHWYSCFFYSVDSLFSMYQS